MWFRKKKVLDVSIVPPVGKVTVNNGDPSHLRFSVKCLEDGVARECDVTATDIDDAISKVRGMLPGSVVVTYVEQVS